nr:MAG TPA: hypothetical protein [Caudoviricetes sp.]DAR88414.1 MAG TPA: hypothetical protein [Bacteriophage sp.]DAU34301.1 MAG TPA: hypothetical protein [Caudoviricetes sp.]
MSKLLSKFQNSLTTVFKTQNRRSIYEKHKK